LDLSLSFLVYDTGVKIHGLRYKGSLSPPATSPSLSRAMISSIALPKEEVDPPGGFTDSRTRARGRRQEFGAWGKGQELRGGELAIMGLWADVLCFGRWD
jgi:hypothetical protein